MCVSLRVRVYVRVCVCVFVTLLSLSLAAEYVDNLKDEGRVCGVIDRLLQYLESKGSTEEVCRVYLRRIMHTYYKFDYKAHRRSLGLQGETKVTGPYYIYLLNILYMHFFIGFCLHTCI